MNLTFVFYINIFCKYFQEDIKLLYMWENCKLLKIQINVHYIIDVEQFLVFFSCLLSDSHSKLQIYHLTLQMKTISGETFNNLIRYTKHASLVLISPRIHTCISLNKRILRVEHPSKMSKNITIRQVAVIYKQERGISVLPTTQYN